MIRKLSFLVATVLLSVSTALAQAPVGEQLDAKQVAAYLKAHPEHQSAFVSDGKGGMRCTDAVVLKQFLNPQARPSSTVSQPAMSISAVEAAPVLAAPAAHSEKMKARGSDDATKRTSPGAEHNRSAAQSNRALAPHAGERAASPAPVAASKSATVAPAASSVPATKLSPAEEKRASRLGELKALLTEDPGNAEYRREYDNLVRESQPNE